MQISPGEPSLGGEEKEKLEPVPPESRTGGGKRRTGGNNIYTIFVRILYYMIPRRRDQLGPNPSMDML